MRKRVDQIGVAEPEPPALGRRPDRRLAARRQERRRGGLAGRHHRPDVVLRLGGQRPRAELQARSAEPERDRRPGGRRRAASRRRCRSSTPSRAARSARAPTPARSPRATSSTWSTRSASSVLAGPDESRADLQKEALNKKIPFDAKQVVKVPAGRRHRPRRAARPQGPSRRRPGTCSRTSRSSAARTSRTPSRASTTARARAASRTSPSTSPARARACGRSSRASSPSAARSPRSAAGRRRLQPALRHHAGQRAHLGPADRLAPVPRRPGRRRGLADLGRLHDRLGPAAGQPAQDGRPADQARAHLGVAGLGHAGQAGAQPGPHRRRRRASSSSRSSC